MITIKTDKEIKKLAYGGKILAGVLKRVCKAAKEGVKTIELDDLAESLIREAGGMPSFKNYCNSDEDAPFPSTLCTCINDELVHTPASARVLVQGDILSIDVGMKYEELYTDMATTIGIGSISSEAKKLMKVTKKSLELAIKQVKPGNYVSDISRAVEDYAKKYNLGVVKDLVGHGVGYEVHEDPRIPNFISNNQKEVELKPGMVIAIEPMLTLGTDKIKVLNDDWTVVTDDGKLCAHFEHTIAVTPKGHLVLTK